MWAIASSQLTVVNVPSAARSMGWSRRSGSWWTSTAARPLWQANPFVTGCSRSGVSLTSCPSSTWATSPHDGSQIRQNVRTVSMGRA